MNLGVIRDLKSRLHNLTSEEEEEEGGEHHGEEEEGGEHHEEEEEEEEGHDGAEEGDHQQHEEVDELLLKAGLVGNMCPGVDFDLLLEEEEEGHGEHLLEVPPDKTDQIEAFLDNLGQPCSSMIKVQFLITKKKELFLFQRIFFFFPPRIASLGASRSPAPSCSRPPT